MGDEYKFTQEAKSDADQKMIDAGMPVYLERLDLSDTQKDRLKREFKAEFEVLKQQRKDDHLEEKWDALDNQYEGEVDEDTLRMFNLNRGVTKSKVDRCVTYLKQAFFESEPIFSVTPRPKFYKEGGLEICSKQTDFLDCKMDQLPFEPEIDLVFHSAACKGTGWLKLYHHIEREPRRREEEYKAQMYPLINPETKQLVVDDKGKPVMKSKGLEQFLTNWPKAAEDYPGYVKKLASGEDIRFVAEYKETVFNDPMPKAVDLKDFYCRTNVNGYHGLKTTKLLVERANFTYWELKKLEDKEQFYDIDKLVEDIKDPGKKIKNYETEDFDILECTFYFKLNESDKDDTKIVFWIEEEKEVVIGSILYPWYAVSCCYIPFYIKHKYPGIYQPGMAEDLTDNNIAENALLNMTLESAYAHNTVTPITNNSEVEAQFLEKRFALGVPIHAKAGEVDFLQKYMSPVDIRGLVMLMQLLAQHDDDASRISSLMSGKETPFDPQAPASKTIALLKQAGVDINDYIKHIVPSFNEIGYVLLAMYYQISEEGREYTIRPENIIGSDENPFGKLERNEMIARTNIQSKALAFDHDKIQEKQTDFALYQILRQEPLVAKNPDAVYTLLKTLVEGWSVKWKNQSSKVIPTLTEFKKQQIMTAMQGVQLYVQAVMENARVTGVKPEFNVEDLLPVIADLEAQLVTPPDPQVAQEQQKQQEALNGS